MTNLRKGCEEKAQEARINELEGDLLEKSSELHTMSVTLTNRILALEKELSGARAEIEVLKEEAYGGEK